jgi:hypothetical protein
MSRNGKKIDDGASPKKKPRTRKPKIHPGLAHLASACVGIEDGTETLESSELAGVSADRCMLYRVGPKSVTNGRRVFLHTFGYYPEIDEIKEMFGGGEFWVQVYSNGGYAGGSPRIAIEGEPKLLKDGSPGGVLGALPSSSDPVVNVLMQTLVPFMDRMLGEIKELKSASAGSTGLNPEKIKELMNAATEAQLTNKLILMATGTGESSAADTEAIAERRLKALLDMFKMGIETGRDGDSGDGAAGILGRFAPLLEKLITTPLTGNVNRPAHIPDRRPAAVTPVGVQAAPEAPVIDVSKTIDPSVMEKDREKLEGETQEFKTQMLVQNLQKGISAMLDAIESEVEYDDKQICDFVMAVVPIGELSLVRTYLTFDKVRLLVQSNPQDQIALDGNQVRVEIVLAELVSRLSE